VTVPMRLTQHEKVLVILYRAAPTDTRYRIDTELFDAWAHFPSSINPDDPKAIRFRYWVAELYANHVGGQPLRGLSHFWTSQGKGGA
jgi:hypothetical protein